MQDVEFAAQKLNDGFGVEYVVLDAGRRPLRLARSMDNTDTNLEILEFHSIQAAFEYLVDVCAHFMMLWSAG